MAFVLAVMKTFHITFKSIKVIVWLFTSLMLQQLKISTLILLFLQELENSEFPDIVPQLRPLMHSVCLVYSHSTFYNSPARIIVLMTETCNLLIGMGRKFLDPTSLFQAS